MDQEYINGMVKILLPATLDTIYMVGLSSFFSVIIGIVLGIAVYTSAKGGIQENVPLNNILGTVINIGRSIPFVILIIAAFPLSKLIVGTGIGKTAAVVPLTIAAIPFVARLVENSFNELGKGVIEATIAMGASVPQIIFKVLIPETAQSIVMNITVTIINLVGYSAMAGMIGGGGLGDVALRYGYQRFRIDILYATIVILVIMVQIIQFTGGAVAKKFDKR